MRLAVISDVHGNLSALRAVLDDIRLRGADQIVCLGDVVSFGPWPAECIELIAGMHDAVLLRGNHDRYVAGAVFRTQEFRQRWPRGFVENEEWTHSLLSAPALEAIAGWRPHAAFRAGSHDLAFVHASRDSDETLLWETATDGELAAALGAGGIRVWGHIHRQHRREVAGTLYFNPGSVGFPFDGDDRAAYAVVEAGGDGRELELVRVEYDRPATLRALRERRAPWLETIRAALEQARSFFDPKLRVEAGAEAGSL